MTQLKRVESTFFVMIQNKKKNKDKTKVIVPSPNDFTYYPNLRIA